MIAYGLIYGLVIIGNCILSSATILKGGDPSSLHLYKTNLRPLNELDYILKRSAGAVANVDESPDSKERRSQMGSSFIRFGRNHMTGTGENIEYSLNGLSDVDSSRIPRGRSDVIIRFGRSGSGKIDSMILRNNKLLKVIPIDIEQLGIVCSDILAADNSSAELARLCNSFMSNDEKNE
ncbi:FMRFamide-related peptides-like [Microplitis mediator]|uniref:FMRFamide-related peptides-like n=1 Tax=Microplitis mediator TaxID=375433 RepID=UPI00255634BD|nr:FMRFamide-related peptides-like [Microplitis mediator]